MRVLINLSGNNSWLEHSRQMGIALKVILESLTTVNQQFLQKFNVPPLYRSGVKYREEPLGLMRFKPVNSAGLIDNQHAQNLLGPLEEFAAIPVIYDRGWGDCDDLAPWRCAELRNYGEKAKIRIQWKRMRNGHKLFHIVVRRENGMVEDPSKILGMGEPKWKNPELYRKIKF